jgi:hypothetical protein
MWQRLINKFKNWWMTIAAYGDLSPDRGIRRTINQTIDERPSRSIGEWYRQFCEPHGIAREVAEFIYDRVGRYSGLKFEKIVPSDRLAEDLKLPMVCWFDWELSLCDEFSQELGVEMADCFDMDELATIGDLMRFFNQRFKSR